MRLLAAPDKMRGTLGAHDVANAMALGAARAGWTTERVAISDGGEGFGICLGGRFVGVSVSGPLGDPVVGGFRLLDDGTAVIEMAAAAGRELLPAPIDDEPLRADTRGVGELIVAAIGAGASRVIVGCGGSATTDGGRGARQVLEAAGGIGPVELLVATDVTTRYVEAATAFAPQKGATPEQVEVLRGRLEDEADELARRYGVDVRALARAGAAGGLAGGLAALGGQLVGGFDVVAASTGLDGAIERADLVATAEGVLDATTLEGKAVASIVELVGGRRPVVVVVGDAHAQATAELCRPEQGSIEVLNLTERLGADRARFDTAAAVAEVLAARLSG